MKNLTLGLVLCAALSGCSTDVQIGEPLSEQEAQALERIMSEGISPSTIEEMGHSSERESGVSLNLN